MLANRVKQTTTTATSGDLTLSGTIPDNFKSFNDKFGTNSRFYYWLVDSGNNQWECGIGYLSASTTMVRELVIDNSTDTTSTIALSAGQKDVFNAPINTTLSVGVAGTTDDASLTLSPGMYTQNIQNISVVAGTIYYIPYWHQYTKRLNGLGVDVVVAQAASNANLGIYEAVDGKPGGKITEIQSLMATTTAAITTENFATPEMLPQGWYFLAAIYDDGNVDVEGSTNATLIQNITGVDATGYPEAGYTQISSGTFLPGSGSGLTLISGNHPTMGVV